MALPVPFLNLRFQKAESKERCREALDETDISSTFALNANGFPTPSNFGNRLSPAFSSFPTSDWQEESEQWACGLFGFSHHKLRVLYVASGKLVSE
ncbi:programmed cell death protein 4-like [Pyrus ussuriensis x Pyrus communis]|uniref:Programmed cell death protein 4-like n=1 Tax=Pyrus ussuriensis x Pyrus communis TaxID=2448454 RepID=A0A5N5IA50_9ROSA|nr:programmed cell death protein 4-like [Pyrus ussuriensis x Pyrus communis]